MPFPDFRTPEPTTPEDERWLAAGIAVFHGSTDPDDFPPLDDETAQRHWLGGFSAAWTECPAEATGWCAQPLDVALMLALAGREALLARFCRGEGAPAVVH
jgi:hypothetical protein